MSNTMKGIVSGFVATLILTAVILLKAEMHISPESNAIVLISKLAGGTVGGWMDHFIIGTLIWGMLFAGFNEISPNYPYWIKGLIFGVFAWFVMMVLFMPFVGLGLFGLKAGLMATVIPLAQHLIYGLALGVTYGLLSAWAPAREAERSHQT